VCVSEEVKEEGGPHGACQVMHLDLQLEGHYSEWKLTAIILGVPFQTSKDL
jgi:hypothetical protein